MTSRKRRAELLGKALDMLIDRPEGLPASTVLENIRESNSLSEEELSTHPSRPLRRFEELIWLGTIAPAKAGWLRNDRECWMFTEEGRHHYQDCANAEGFIAQAAARSRKGWASVHFPESYSLLSKATERVLIESRLLRRVGPRELFSRAFGLTPSWEEVLPLQAPQRLVVPNVSLKVADDLLDHLNSKGVDIVRGGHAIYLSPETWRKTAFHSISDNYPENAGLKIVSTPGEIKNSSYVRPNFWNGRGQSILQKNVIHDHPRLTVVANLLYTHGVGPRLYDLVELECGESVWVGYVVEHVNGHVPSEIECTKGIEQIRALEDAGLILNNLPDGWNDDDFQPPVCKGNAFIDDAGRFHYIDFQNFILTDYQKYLKGVALEATAKSHFGESSLLRGRRPYLYQSIPGLDLPAKRNPEQRMEVVSSLMKIAGVSLAGRLVLDVGCNIGGMMAQYLKHGARWCHGWDRDYVTPHTEKLLLALGCTRFTTTGGDIDQDKNLRADLSHFLQASLDGSVISYLAVRGHLGWLKALERIPWSFLIYEGHEGESQSDFDKHLKELQGLVKFHLAASSKYVDGDSDERTVAILVRSSS